MAGLHDPPVRAAHRHPASTTSWSSTSRASATWSTPSAASRCASPRTSTTRPTASTSRPATRELSGYQALNYVRARYVGELIRRHRPDQAPAGLHRRDGPQGQSAGTLTRPDRLVNFLDAATKSLTTDEELGSVTHRQARDGAAEHRPRQDPVRHRALEYSPRDPDPRQVFWPPEAEQLWEPLNEDKVLPASSRRTSISAERRRPARRDDADPAATATGRRSGHRRETRPSRVAPTETPSETPSGHRATRPGGADRRALRVSPTSDPTEPREPEWKRRQRLAAVFGDGVPEQTKDDRDAARGRRRQGRRLVPRPGAAAPRLTGTCTAAALSATAAAARGPVRRPPRP